MLHVTTASTKNSLTITQNKDTFMNTDLSALTKEKSLNFTINSEYDMNADARVTFDADGDSYFEASVSRNEPDSSNDTRRAKCTMSLTAHLWDKDSDTFIVLTKNRSVSFYGELYDNLFDYMLDEFPTVASVQKWVETRLREQSRIAQPA